MTLNEYQTKALKTAIYPPEQALNYCVLGLASEAGELAGKLKKEIRDGKSMTEELKAELGDILWYVANTAEQLYTSLDEIAQANLKKLQSRQERGVIGGSGDNR